MTSLVTQAEYARLRGVSKQSVGKAVKANRITLVDGKVDVEAANAQWAARTDPAQQQRGAPKQFAKAASAAAAEIDASKTTDHGVGLSLLGEKTRMERLRIRKQEIELEELEGRSVSRDAVVAALSAKLIAAGETLQAIPDRFAALFASESDANVIHRLLTTEIRNAMSAIATVPEALH